MTRENKKAAERSSLDLLLRALEIMPNDIAAGETPDFQLTVGDKLVGVELTIFQSNTQMDGELSLRQVESEWERLYRRIEAFRAARPELEALNVGIMFKGPGPAPISQQAFIEEIAAFALSKTSELTEHDTQYFSPAFSSPLMIQLVRSVFLRRCKFAQWYSNLTAGAIGLPDTTLTEIIVDKAARHYQKVDELWLAIQSTHRISELLVPLNGANDFIEVPGLTHALNASPFARVFIFGPLGIFDWSRGSGWQTR